jgi:hypothetical protein
MLEAVNSVISNAPFLRQSVEQLSSANFALEESAVTAPQAPYVSPYIFVNNDYNTAVLQIRDSDTGDVLKQFPSEQTLAARHRQKQAQLALSRADDVSVSDAVHVDVSSSAESSSAGAADVSTAQTNVYTEAQIVSSASSPSSRAPSADAVSAAISQASASGSAPSSGTTVSVQA